MQKFFEHATKKKLPETEARAKAGQLARLCQKPPAEAGGML